MYCNKLEKKMVEDSKVFSGKRFYLSGIAKSHHEAEGAKSFIKDLGGSVRILVRKQDGETTYLVYERMNGYE
jgi:hypothetical protein